MWCGGKNYTRRLFLLNRSLTRIITLGFRLAQATGWAIILSAITALYNSSLWISFVEIRGLQTPDIVDGWVQFFFYYSSFLRKYRKDFTMNYFRHSLLIYLIKIIIIITLVQTINQVSSDSNCISNDAEWDSSLVPYPGLKEYIERHTGWQSKESFLNNN